MCVSSETCDMRSEFCMNASVGTTDQESGTTSTPLTLAPSSTVYDIIEQAVIETAVADVLCWEQQLRAKYGIPQAMEKA